MGRYAQSAKFWILVVTLACFPGVAWAANTVLSGVFNGAEARTASLPGGIGNGSQLGYQVIGFSVASSGSYTMTDVFSFNGVDVTALIYQGAFNPGAAQTNLLTTAGVDFSDMVNLSSGVNYNLVVQHWGQNREGAWAVSFSGPGSVSSAAQASIPARTMGEFTAADPVMNSACGSGQYQQSGPVEVTRNGSYFYTDISINFAADTCLQVYTAPLDPANPGANRVALLDDVGQVELSVGTAYYFVVQPFGEPVNAEFFYVLAPPADFRLNPGMAGSWFNPATNGQGFFLDVFDGINQIFLAWFTYELARPDDSVTAAIGDPGHRWLTAFGPFEGNSANLDIEWTVGGVFDSTSPATTQSIDGSILVEFENCNSGTVSYDLGTAGTSGVVPIQRIANDSVELCQQLIFGPGQPGPL